MMGRGMMESPLWQDWLCASICPRQEHILAILINAFGDESADETAQRVFAVSCLIGTDKEWDNVKEAWIQRTGGKEFHAAECETG
jgi:hypothetical protein